VADRPGAHLLTPPDADARLRGVTRVLSRVLVLNLLVAGAKIAFGASSGTVSILSDGIHSLTDSASNVVALVATRVARRAADSSHPYGHRKFETLASAAIFVLLFVALVEVVEAAVGRLRSGDVPEASPASFVVMGVTLAINLAVVRHESRESRRLRSEVLLADSYHTLSDVFTSVTVIGALVGVRLGWPLLDPLAALVVAAFIGRAGYRIARDVSDVLADRAVIEPDAIRAVVTAMPDVVGCHAIRTRGSSDHTFLDLHVWFRPDMRLDEAHRRSHMVKDRLMEAFPSVRDVVIHIEPPPEHGGDAGPDRGGRGARGGLGA
jgi:cation diffusion facilitator family transporter